MNDFVNNNIIGTQYEWQSHIENVFQLLNHELTQFRPTNLLDVGFGTGDRTMRIANHFNINPKMVYGVDFDNKLVNSCQKAFNANRIDLEIEDLPFNDSQFDLVFCNQVLEHLKNYQKARQCH